LVKHRLYSKHELGKLLNADNTNFAVQVGLHNVALLHHSWFQVTGCIRHAGKGKAIFCESLYMVKQHQYGKRTEFKPAFKSFIGFSRCHIAALQRHSQKRILGWF